MRIRSAASAIMLPAMTNSPGLRLRYSPICSNAAEGLSVSPSPGAGPVAPGAAAPPGAVEEPAGGTAGPALLRSFSEAGASLPPTRGSVASRTPRLSSALVTGWKNVVPPLSHSTQQTEVTNSPLP